MHAEWQSARDGVVGGTHFQPRDRSAFIALAVRAAQALSSQVPEELIRRFGRGNHAHPDYIDGRAQEEVFAAYWRSRAAVANDDPLSDFMTAIPPHLGPNFSSFYMPVLRRAWHDARRRTDHDFDAATRECEAAVCPAEPTAADLRAKRSRTTGRDPGDAAQQLQPPRPPTRQPRPALVPLPLGTEPESKMTVPAQCPPLPPSLPVPRTAQCPPLPPSLPVPRKTSVSAGSAEHFSMPQRPSPASCVARPPLCRPSSVAKRPPKASDGAIPNLPKRSHAPRQLPMVPLPAATVPTAPAASTKIGAALRDFWNASGRADYEGDDAALAAALDRVRAEMENDRKAKLTDAAEMVNPALATVVCAACSRYCVDGYR